MARVAALMALGVVGRGCSALTEQQRPLSGGQEEALTAAAVSPEERDALSMSELMSLLEKELRAEDTRSVADRAMRLLTTHGAGGDSSYSYDMSYSYSYMSYSYGPTDEDEVIIPAPKTATVTIALKFQMDVTDMTPEELNTPEFIGAVTVAIVSSLADLEVPATTEEIQDMTFALATSRRRSLKVTNAIVVSYNFVRVVTEGGGQDLDAISTALLVAVQASMTTALNPPGAFGTALNNAVTAAGLTITIVVDVTASVALVAAATVTYVIVEESSSSKKSSSDDGGTIIIIVVVVVVLVVLLGALAAFFMLRGGGGGGGVPGSPGSTTQKVHAEAY